MSRQVRIKNQIDKQIGELKKSLDSYASLAGGDVNLMQANVNLMKEKEDLEESLGILKLTNKQLRRELERYRELER